MPNIIKINSQSIKEIYYSRTSFIDLWLSILMILLGLLLICNDAIENIPQYYFLNKSGVSSDNLGLLCFSVGSINLIKVFFFIKKNLFFFAFIKSIMIVVFLLLFFTTFVNPIIPMGSVFYLMALVLAIESFFGVR